MPDFHRYPPLEAPDVQVLTDGAWYDGVAEARRRDDDGRWLWFIRWTSSPGANHLGWYDHDQVRKA